MIWHSSIGSGLDVKETFLQVFNYDYVKWTLCYGGTRLRHSWHPGVHKRARERFCLINLILRLPPMHRLRKKLETAAAGPHVVATCGSLSTTSVLRDAYLSLTSRQKSFEPTSNSGICLATHPARQGIALPCLPCLPRYAYGFLARLHGSFKTTQNSGLILAEVSIEDDEYHSRWSKKCAVGYKRGISPLLQNSSPATHFTSTSKH